MHLRCYFHYFVWDEGAKNENLEKDDRHADCGGGHGIRKCHG